MKYFVVLVDGEKKIVPGTPENRNEYKDNIVFIGNLKNCHAIVEGCNPVTNMKFNESYCHTSWSEDLRDKLVIVGYSKDHVRQTLERWLRGGPLFYVDYVCDSEEDDKPFCDMGDDDLWEVVYYDPELSDFLQRRINDRLERS